MKRFFILIAVLACLGGCTTHISDLSVISNKNIDTGQIDLDAISQKKHVEGQDDKFVFLFIPFGQPTLKEALNDALEKGGGDLMINASVYVRQWWFLIGRSGIRIKGDVVNTKRRK